MELVAGKCIAAWRKAWRESSGPTVRLLRFLYEPASHMWPGRLLKIFPDRKCIDLLSSGRRGWLLFNDRIREQLRLKENCEFPTFEERHKLIYERAELLLRLELFIGSALFSENVRLVVRRGNLDALMEKLGEEIYSFALRKAVFFQAHGLPVPLQEFQSLPLPERIACAGRWCVAACIADLPEAILERFALKFPEEEKWKFPTPMDGESVSQLWQFVQRVLRRCGEGGA